MGGSGVDHEKLSSWMEIEGLGAGKIDNIKLLTGGTQNILMQFDRAGRSFVLRRPPHHLRDSSNEAMRREARILKALAGTPVPHPQLIAACGDESVLGAAFFLMEPVAGFNPANGLPTLHAKSKEVRHQMGLAVVEGIAALGDLNHVALGLADFGKTENFLERQMRRWKSQLDSYAQIPEWPGPSHLPQLDAVTAWLDKNRPPAFEPGVMHGDCHMGNVIFSFDGPRLEAIVDWELATIGDPLLDLGWLLATWRDVAHPNEALIPIEPWTGFPTQQELIGHYKQLSNRDLSHIDWYAVLACYKLGVILEGTHARSCAGKAPDEVGTRAHSNAIILFERALRWIA